MVWLKETANLMMNILEDNANKTFILVVMCLPMVFGCSLSMKNRKSSSKEHEYETIKYFEWFHNDNEYSYSSKPEFKFPLDTFAISKK